MTRAAGQTVVLCFALIYVFATVGFLAFPEKFAFENAGASEGGGGGGREGGRERERE